MEGSPRVHRQENLTITVDQRHEDPRPGSAAWSAVLGQLGRREQTCMQHQSLMRIWVVRLPRAVHHEVNVNARLFFELETQHASIAQARSEQAASRAPSRSRQPE